jgi:hypothetical protein
MPDPVELVLKHLDAVAGFDWRAVEASMMAGADLSLEGVVDWKWDVDNLYRFISQAWDFSIFRADLVGAEGGAVTGTIVLLSGAWRKEVTCEYRVVTDLISSIAFSDRKPFNTLTE